MLFGVHLKKRKESQERAYGMSFINRDTGTEILFGFIWYNSQIASHQAALLCFI